MLYNIFYILYSLAIMAAVATTVDKVAQRIRACYDVLPALYRLRNIDQHPNL